MLRTRVAGLSADRLAKVIVDDRGAPNRTLVNWRVADVVRIPHFAEPKRLSARTVRFQLVAIGASLTALSSPVAGAAVSEPPAGAVIYIRDVPHRQAHLPGEPGQPNFVDAGPDELIMTATGIGLKPLTDEQQSAVSAPIQQLFDAPTRAPEGWSVAGLSQPGQTAPGAAAIERSGGVVAGAVGGAVSQVTSALSAVSNALAGPR